MNASALPVADAALSAPFLQGLSTRDARSVLAVATPRRFLAHSVVQNQGDRVHNLYLLTEGRARYFYITPEGRKILFSLIMPGELFATAVLIPSMHLHLVSVEILQPSRVLVWDKETVHSLTKSYPKLLENALSIVGGYVEWLIHAHIRLACHSAPYRLAQTLLNLARELGGPNPAGRELTVTNEDLANAANVTPFTASRLMRAWHRAGILRKGRGKIVLLAPERLFSGKV
jgi:CRP-like cAMP-binding protein